MKKEIFLVDADDTVLNFHGVSEKALKYAFEQSGEVWKEEYLPKFRAFNGKLWEALERKELTRDELMDTRFCLFMKHIALPQVDGKAFNRLFLDFLANNPMFMDGAQGFLQTLKTMGRVYIVTNGTAWIQKRRFTICNLYAHADDVFVSELIGADKPDKRYTEYVIRHIDGFEREKAVWIGDSLSADIKAANEAGIASIWFNPAKKPVSRVAHPDYIAHDFEDALKILRNENEKNSSNI